MAAAILALIAVMLLQAFISISLFNEVNRNNGIAVSHAQYVLEDIKSTNFNEIANGIASGNWNWNAAIIAAKGMIPLNSEVIITQASGTADLLNVIVTVSWQDRGQKPRSTVLQTFFSNPV